MIWQLEKNNTDLMNRFLSAFPHLSRSKIYEELDNNPYVRYLFYEKDNQIVGFLNYSEIYDRIEINQIEVISEYRRQKIASALMAFLLEIANQKNATNITLEVRSTNTAAIGLYEKYGFIKVAIRPGYYNGIDGILMEKEMIK